MITRANNQQWCFSYLHEQPIARALKTMGRPSRELANETYFGLASLRVMVDRLNKCSVDERLVEDNLG